MLKDIQSCLQVPDILFHKIHIISTPHKLQMGDSGLSQPIQCAGNRIGSILTLDGYLDHTVHLIFKEGVCFFDPV